MEVYEVTMVNTLGLTGEPEKVEATSSIQAAEKVSGEKMVTSEWKPIKNGCHKHSGHHLCIGHEEGQPITCVSFKLKNGTIIRVNDTHRYKPPVKMAEEQRRLRNIAIFGETQLTIDKGVE